MPAVCGHGWNVYIVAECKSRAWFAASEKPGAKKVVIPFGTRVQKRRQRVVIREIISRMLRRWKRQEKGKCHGFKCYILQANGKCYATPCFQT